MRTPADPGCAHWLGRASRPGRSSVLRKLGCSFLISSLGWEHRGLRGAGLAPRAGSVHDAVVSLPNGVSPSACEPAQPTYETATQEEQGRGRPACLPPSALNSSTSFAPPSVGATAKHWGRTGGDFPLALTLLTAPAVGCAAPTPLPAVLSGLVLASGT